MALDVVLAIVATWIAYSLRLDGFHSPSDAQWWVYGIAPLLAIPIFIRFGLYRAIFRYTGQAALAATGKAVAVYALLLSAMLLWQQWTMVPRSLLARVLQMCVCIYMYIYINIKREREREGGE
jgi:FlaA1/EpsC-like NDP-sugar epimerase